LYEEPIPNAYLGVPISNRGRLDVKRLIARNSLSALTNMRILNNIGLNPSGFSRLLASRLYAQFIRPKLEYGLAIISFTKTQLKEIEHTQNTCVRMIYGAHTHSETKVMRHLAKLP
ncbi:hypothetical protein DFQ29_000511, partial [Apophysomyces sp. BC1021]